MCQRSGGDSGRQNAHGAFALRKSGFVQEKPDFLRAFDFPRGKSKCLPAPAIGTTLFYKKKIAATP